MGRAQDSISWNQSEIRRLQAMVDVDAAKMSSAVAEVELHADRQKKCWESIERCEERIKHLEGKGASDADRT